MNDHNDSENRPSEINCGISEEQFPTMRTCCIYGGFGTLPRYRSICPHCKEWTLPPTGENLEVVTIFECGRYGYCKRVKE